MGRRAALAGLGAVAIVATATQARGATPAALSAALTDDVDVVLLPSQRRPAARPTVTVATRVQAAPDAVGAVLLEPSRYGDAIPALIGSEIVATRPGADARFGPERLLAWELEIPLFNLKGRAWLARTSDAIELTLIEGAFAPGRVRFQLTGEDGRRATLFTCEVTFTVQASNWLLRRVARHDAWSETAMTAAVAWTLARAVAALAETTPQGGQGQGQAVRPRGPMVAPDATKLDGAALAGPAWASLRMGAPVAAVRRAASGRLAWISAAVALPGAAPEVATRLATPETWGVFPGWGSVQRLPVPDGAPRGEQLVAAKDSVPFVDLDATWRVTSTSSVVATAVAGATRGAVFRWQTFVAPSGPVSVLSMHPRLDAAGFIEKRMIAAEPLLEHALALALTYVDAAAVADAFQSP